MKFVGNIWAWTCGGQAASFVKFDSCINHEEIEAISQIVNDKYLHTLACTGFVGLSPHKIIAYLTILVFRRTIYTPRLLV